MRWETPKFVEIKMDAEVSSYQEDGGDPLDPPFLAPEAHEPASEQPSR